MVPSYDKVTLSHGDPYEDEVDRFLLFNFIPQSNPPRLVNGASSAIFRDSRLGSPVTDCSFFTPLPYKSKIRGTHFSRPHKPLLQFQFLLRKSLSTLVRPTFFFFSFLFFFSLPVRVSGIYYTPCVVEERHGRSPGGRLL